MRTHAHDGLRSVRLPAVVMAMLVALLALFPGSAGASEPASDQGTAQFETRFMMEMIDHHTMAIQMAEMCLEKATHQQLKDLCTNIKTSQMEEREDMQAWLEEWYGIDYEPEMKPGDMRQMERLAELSGAEFEIAFMEMMSKHHAKAIKSASRCLDRAEHDDLLELCENIVETQSAEIELMQGWLCDWYGMCQPRRS